jgi:outer membrane protein
MIGRLGTALGGSFVLIGSLMGQEPPTMTLEEALSIAQERNPSLLSAQSQVGAASVGVRSAWGSFLPSLTAQMRWNGGSNTTLSGTDDYGQTVTLPTPITVRSSSATQGLGSSLTVFDGFRNVNTLRERRFSLDAAQSAVDYRGLEIAAEVKSRFYNALRIERLVRVEEQLLASAREQLDANERRFRIAAAKQVDVLGAQVEVARQELALDQQMGEARKARLQVLQTLGVLGEVVDVTLVGDFPEVFDPSTLRADDLVQRAVEVHPLIAQRQAEASAAGRSLAAARGQWLPTLSLNAGWARSLNQRDLGAMLNFDPNQNRGYNVGINITWDVFNGFQRSQQIGQASAVADQADETLRLETLQLEQQIRAALIDLQNAYDALQTQQRATDLSRRRVELAREEYRINAIEFTSLQRIIDDASQAERSLVDAQFGFANAVVTIEQRVGELVR